jgi:hypothetical protein
MLIPHKNSLIVLVLVAVCSLSAWIMVVLRTDPFSTTAWPQLAFFLSLFFAVTSILALAGFFARLLLYRNEVFFFHLTIALRQGVMAGFLLCIGLYFQHLRVLTWWNAILLIAILVLLEVFFQSREE